MKKHVVLIKSNNPEKFNYCKFGNYKDKQGRSVNLVDINDQMTDGYEMSHALVSLDINQKQDKRVYTFLKDHPLISNFTLEDIRANEEKNAEGALKSAEAITKATKLSDNAMKDLALLMGMESDLDDTMLKDDQAIVWLKENADLYAMLRRQVRTGQVAQPVQTEEKVLVTQETAPEPQTMSTSTINALENDAKEKGWFTRNKPKTNK